MIFVLGYILAVILYFFSVPIFLHIYLIYIGAVFLQSTYQNKNVLIGILSIQAVFIQLCGYGIGFINSYFHITILKQKPENAFPELFFKKK